MEVWSSAVFSFLLRAAARADLGLLTVPATVVISELAGHALPASYGIRVRCEPMHMLRV